MSPAVQLFSCPSCKRGEFRSLPGPDGKAFCPWCGGLVAGTSAPLPDPATPLPAVSSGAGPATAVDSDNLAQLLDRVGSVVPEATVRALRDRIADLDRKRAQSEAELRHELDKKLEIKRAVSAEMGQLGSQLGETKVRLKQTEDQHQSVLAEANRLKEELGRERQKAGQLEETRVTLEGKEKTVKTLESELEARGKSVHELQDAREAGQREADKLRLQMAQAKEAADGDLAELRRKLAAAETKLRSHKDAGEELVSLKAKLEEQRRRAEKERGDLQQKVSALQAEGDKKDQRVRELQLLIKTLGERLNELSNRRPS